MSPLAIIQIGNVLGEGVVWHQAEKCLYWVDIEGKCLYQLALDDDAALETDVSRRIKHFDTPERLCSFGLCASAGWIIAGFESGFAYYHFKSGTIHWISKPPELKENMSFRLNDGRVDRQGRFWCGAMVEDEAIGFGANLYCLNHKGDLSSHASEIGISNGICWSPKGDYFYFADSRRQVIYRYSYEKHTGHIHSKTVFAETATNVFPDGAVTDEYGCLWSAHWGSGQIVRYTPEGRIDQFLTVPASQPSCVAFGGEKNNLLFVTSATQGLSQSSLASEPQAGNIFVYRVLVHGITEPYFAGNPA